MEAPERRGQDLLKRPSETGARISKRQENITVWSHSECPKPLPIMEELLGIIPGAARWILPVIL